MKINSLASDKPSTKIYDRTVIDRCLPKVYMSHFLHLALLSVFSFGSANVHFYLSLLLLRARVCAREFTYSASWQGLQCM